MIDMLVEGSPSRIQLVIAAQALDGNHPEQSSQERHELAKVIYALLDVTAGMEPAEEELYLRFPEQLSHMRHLREVLAHDFTGLVEKESQYRGSWKSRGGVGAFMMLARKWDRLEPFVKLHGYDIFTAIYKDPRPEGAIDDIRDLRRYLALVESHCIDVNLIAQATP